MNVHNIMEDIVKLRVDSLYTQIKDEKATWLSCDCQNCRADVTSYVLNRIQPKYVVSGRGAAHSANLLDDHQLRADINALCLEGIRVISSSKRQFHQLSREECKITKRSEPVFNFPTFQGTILDGNTFAPLADARILLMLDGKKLEMADKTWANPATTYLSTNGSYSFWAKSLPAEKADILKTFNFTIEVEAEGYSPVCYNFELHLKSQEQVQEEFNTNYAVKIKEIVLFKEDL